VHWAGRSGGGITLRKWRKRDPPPLSLPLHLLMSSEEVADVVEEEEDSEK
jgi:hypothetical protein